MGIQTVKVVKVTTDEQYNELLEIRKIVFIGEQNVPEELELDEHEHTATYVIAYDEHGTPMATGRIREYGEATGKMQRIAVLKEARGGGYGRAVMEKLEELGREELGFTTFVLEAQTHAEDFYKKLGYETVSEVFMEAGIPHVKMEKHA